MPHPPFPTPPSALAALWLLFPAAPADPSPPTLLPELWVHLEASRYAPVETGLEWTGWLGAGAGLLRVRESTAYFTADLETILGSERRAFDATQANYHLELGVRTRMGAYEAGPFFHHVSRHAVDRPKPQAVDWNVLGVRAGRRWRRLWARASIGHTTLASLVGYRWELEARVEAPLVTPGGSSPALYAASGVRLVSRKRSPAFPDRGFADLAAEAGLVWNRGPRALRVFVAFERRNDVLLEAGGRRDRARLGFRIGEGWAEPR